ncbi:MAG TPA: CBS domain-containing protein [Acetobacteraceae bacterium]
MTIAAVLREKGASIISVAPETGMAEVAHVIATRRIGAVVVMDAARKLVGILSERDVVKALSQRGSAVLDLKAATS